MNSTYRVSLTRISHNAKTGPIPVSTTESKTCPPLCGQYDTCYGKYGPLGIHWGLVDRGERGVDWSEFCEQVRRLPKGQLWRHNQAGDLPGDGTYIDSDALRALVEANRGKRGFTYTHYKVYCEDTLEFFHMQLTHTRLKEVLHYDPATGVFTWLVRTGARGNVGSVAGSVKKVGYRYISVDGTSYLAHRLAWLYMTGKLPTESIDHKDMNPVNNRWGNLREASKSENAQNQREPQKNNRSSQYLGVSWSKRERKWLANINLEGKRIYLGRFDVEEDARDAYLQAKLKYHPFAAAAEHNRALIEAANANGFTVNVSCDTLTDTDRAAQRVDAPLAVVLHGDTQGKTVYTPDGIRVVVCPATYRDDMNCANCGICAESNYTRTPVGFPAHGTKKKVINLRLEKAA
jgi:hypothetical protein